MKFDEVIQFVEARAKGLRDKRNACLDKGLTELYRTFDEQLHETLLTLAILQKKAEPAIKKPWYSKLLFWRKA